MAYRSTKEATGTKAQEKALKEQSGRGIFDTAEKTHKAYGD